MCNCKKKTVVEPKKTEENGQTNKPADSVSSGAGGH